MDTQYAWRDGELVTQRLSFGSGLQGGLCQQRRERHSRQWEQCRGRAIGVFMKYRVAQCARAWRGVAGDEARKLDWG